MKKLSYAAIAAVLVGIFLLFTAYSNYSRPVNQAFLDGCDILQKNYSCNPVETFSIVVPDYKLEDGSFAHLVDVCGRLRLDGQSECVRACGCG